MDRTGSEHVREQTEQWSLQQPRTGGAEPLRRVASARRSAPAPRGRG